MPESTQTFRIEIRFDFTGTVEEAKIKAVETADEVGGEVTAIFDEEFEEV